MTYTPAVWQEWLAMAAILAAGASCLWLGIWSSRRSTHARNTAAAMGLALAVGAAAAHYPPLRDVVGPCLSLPGGEGALACLGTLALLGIAEAERKQSSRRPVRAAAFALVFLALFAFSSGSVGWHYFGQSLRANYPDASGALQQTTGITCAPAAAAMLLYHSGLRISEGAMAELAHTSFIQGTAPYALARAVDRVARRQGLRGCIQRVDYARAVCLRHPFVAFINRPGIGGHALCVLKAAPEKLLVIDPLSGMQETVQRDQFVAGWDPVIIWIEPSAHSQE